MFVYSQEITDALTAEITTPTLLVYLDYSVPVALSTRGDVTYNNVLYKQGSIKGDISISGNAIEGSKCRIQLINLDSYFTGLVLNEGGSGIAAKVYQYFSSETAILLIDGVINNFTELGPTAKVEIVSRDVPDWTPKKRITLDDFPYLTQPGTKLNVGNISIILK